MLPAYLTMYVSDAEVSANVGSVNAWPRVCTSAPRWDSDSCSCSGSSGWRSQPGQHLCESVSVDRLLTGFVMAGLGAYLFAGGKIYTGGSIPTGKPNRRSEDASLKGYFLFGISYAVASLSCTLLYFLPSSPRPCPRTDSSTQQASSLHMHWA